MAKKHCKLYSNAVITITKFVPKYPKTYLPKSSSKSIIATVLDDLKIRRTAIIPKMIGIISNNVITKDIEFLICTEDIKTVAKPVDIISRINKVIRTNPILYFFE